MEVRFLPRPVTFGERTRPYRYRTPSGRPSQGHAAPR